MSRVCAALGVSRATAYRRMRQGRQQPQPELLSQPEARPEPPPQPSASGGKRTYHRRIPDEERSAILDVLGSERFVDQPPREVYGALLSEGVFMCSWRTMYHVLNERGPIKERPNQREAKSHAVLPVERCRAP